ncbi:hypothetical protein AWB67_07622 [Caballeronia terrestris]|uniref:Uncharacterized protein n=1 Tax=Caballeronia terrestris TaxID=1226301 RepID=A0A158L5N0_9BURK|nr:hypothetical protein AWB67_07622 [Caballeronia terrestris]
MGHDVSARRIGECGAGARRVPRRIRCARRPAASTRAAPHAARNRCTPPRVDLRVSTAIRGTSAGAAPLSRRYVSRHALRNGAAFARRVLYERHAARPADRSRDQLDRSVVRAAPRCGLQPRRGGARVLHQPVAEGRGDRRSGAGRFESAARALPGVAAARRARADRHDARTGVDRHGGELSAQPRVCRDVRPADAPSATAHGPRRCAGRSARAPADARRGARAAGRRCGRGQARAVAHAAVAVSGRQARPAGAGDVSAAAR